MNALSKALPNHLISGNKKEWQDFTAPCLLSSRSHVRVVPGSPTTFYFALRPYLFTCFTSFPWFHKTIGGNMGETVLNLSAQVNSKLAPILSASAPNENLLKTNRNSKGRRNLMEKVWRALCDCRLCVPPNKYKAHAWEGLSRTTLSCPKSGVALRWVYTTHPGKRRTNQRRYNETKFAEGF